MWLILALLSAVMAALVGILGKVGLNNMDANSATAIRAVIMALFLAGVVMVQGKLGSVSEILADKRGMMFICLSGVAGALSWLFYFWALKVGKVTQVAPVDKFSVVIAAVLAMVFLGERMSPLGIGGIVAITAGVLMVAFA